MGPRILQHPFHLFCILMNVLHVYYLSDKYFRFEVTTKVQIAVPDELVIPSFTICSNLLYLMKWNELTLDQRRRLFTHPTTNKSLVDNQLIPSSLELLSQSNANRFGFYSNIYRLFNTSFLINHSKNFWEIVEKNVVNPVIGTNLTTRTNNFFEIGLTFIKFYQKCFTLRFRRESPKTISYDDLLTSQGESWLNFIVYFPHNHDILQYTHDSGHVITSVDTPKTIKPRHFLRFHCETYTSRLLPFPYSTNCRDYSTVQITSKPHCKQKCMRNTIIDKYQSIPLGFHAYGQDKYPIRILVINQSEWSFIIKKCQGQCWQKDCSSIMFNCVKGKSDASRGNQSIALTTAYNGPVTQTETQSDTSFIVFATNVLSTLGIWLGVSFLSSGPRFKRIVQRIYVAQSYRNMKARLSKTVDPLGTKKDRVEKQPPLFVKRFIEAD